MAPKRPMSFQVYLVAFTSVAALLAAAWIAKSQPSTMQCRCFPGDPCWPSAAQWGAFNSTVEGRLIATVPVASPCHDTFPGVAYDAEKCADIQANWPRPELHDETTHSPMAYFFANLSCDPFTPRDAQCVVGSYVAYVVNATGASDYQKTIAFAKQHNIRLVIRNTGHDYLGKSTGAGALAIWTHHIKDMSILDYGSTAYSGKAMKLGAGVQASEAQTLAHDNGFVIVEGDCPTVGITGGYTQGGGTSPLASKFGLAADQVLEWEVVTGSGELLTATPSQNTDLYWALSGGGGGTYGVVLSMTIKLHQDMPTAGATLSFVDASDKYWNAVQSFLVTLPPVLKAGAVVYWQTLPGSMFNMPGNIFSMPQAYLPNGTAQELEKLLQPTLLHLNQSGVPYAFSSNDFPTFKDSFTTLVPEMNISAINIGGRLVPRSLVENETAAASLTSAIGSVIASGGILAGVSMDTSNPPTSPNSVNPEWRETLFLAFMGNFYNNYNFTANLLGQRIVTDVLVPALEKLTPGGAAYLNEADFNQPNWQDVFYGPNYAKLLAVKKRFDPDGIIWGQTAVGSEGWEILADGRLCTTT
ncbi:hypothetical protein GGR56DRAFT_645769 [Xylariaceae sp. FL0804]|nr:hypothetical protein GGR56DRAFT_645769 [Xylariaceae sp. FL0804]